MLAIFRHQGLEEAVPSTSLAEFKTPQTLSHTKHGRYLMVQGERQNCPQKKPEVLTHQERMAVSIVTGPDGAHASPELSDGDLPVGHDVCEVGAHLWGKKTTMLRDRRKRCAVVTFWMAAPRCEGPHTASDNCSSRALATKKSSFLGLQANVNRRDGP